MPTVAIVEDEPSIARLMQMHLEAAGFASRHFETGDAFLRALPSFTPDVVLLDWMLPGERDGIAVLRALRENPETRALHVILVTAKAEELDRVLGLEVGADDYLTKPFSLREMSARVRAQLRRRSWESENVDCMRHGDIVLDKQAHRVSVRGKAVSLSPKEFDILSMLMERPNWVVTREQLLSAIWGADFDGEMHAVDMHMTNLRRKLEEAGAEGAIQTVRAVGFKMRRAEE